MTVTGSAAFMAAMASIKKLCTYGDDYRLRDAVINEVETLQADNARLRALVTSAQSEQTWINNDGYEERLPICPWCQSEHLPRHEEKCRAFHPNGEVR